jgi:hypothetical protein
MNTDTSRATEAKVCFACNGTGIIKGSIPAMDRPCVCRDDSQRNVWPDELMIRDTRLHDDMGGGGQRIYTTAGQGYEKRRYIRADLARQPAEPRAQPAEVEWGDSFVPAQQIEDFRTALEAIKSMTDADNPESYRADDREGC